MIYSPTNVGYSSTIIPFGVNKSNLPAVPFMASISNGKLVQSHGKRSVELVKRGNERPAYKCALMVDAIPSGAYPFYMHSRNETVYLWNDGNEIREATPDSADRYLVDTFTKSIVASSYADGERRLDDALDGLFFNFIREILLNHDPGSVVIAPFQINTGSLNHAFVKIEQMDLTVSSVVMNEKTFLRFYEDNPIHIGQDRSLWTAKIRISNHLRNEECFLFSEAAYVGSLSVRDSVFINGTAPYSLSSYRQEVGFSVTKGRFCGIFQEGT